MIIKRKWSMMLICFGLLQLPCNLKDSKELKALHPHIPYSQQFKTTARLFGDVVFSGKDTMWGIGEDAFCWTGDGGKSWRKIPFGSDYRFERISFIDEYNGWATDEQTFVYRTRDGGINWQRLGQVMAGHDFFVQQQLTFIDESHGWLIDPFSVWRTEDGGKSWRQTQITYGSGQLKHQLVKAFFVNHYKGWLGGTGGIIYSTDDGGKSWKQEMRSVNSSDITDLFFLDQSTGWVSKGGWNMESNTYTAGIHSYSIDQNWHQLPFPDKNTVIESLHFIDRNNGWAVGYRGKPTEKEPYSTQGIVLYTTNGGKKWEVVFAGSDPNYYRVFFSDPAHGWLLSTRNVYRSLDSGRTWRSVSDFPTSK